VPTERSGSYLSASGPRVPRGLGGVPRLHPGGLPPVTHGTPVPQNVGGSMSTVTATGDVAGAPPLSFLQRIVGTFTSPRSTFESLRDHPKWVDVFILHLVVASLTFIPLQPIILKDSLEKGAAKLDKMEMSEEQKATARERQTEMMGKFLSVPVG